MTRFTRVIVWAGGAMFVLSLAAAAYAYVIGWAPSPAAVGGRRTGLDGRAAAIDAALFAVFALHHSLFARDFMKRAIARFIPDRLIRSLYVWTASVLLLTALALWQPVDGLVYTVTGWRILIHAAVQLAGVCLIAWSAARIDALELAGIKPTAGSESLQIAGPYRWVRHPLYLGWLLVVFGTAHMTGDRLAFAAISTAYLLVAIPWEERSLLRLFGEPYARYRRTVRWRVVPFVY